MKRFLPTFFALILFSTVGVFGGSISQRYYAKSNLGDILTIKGVSLNKLNWGNQSKPNTPVETMTQTTMIQTTEKPIESTTMTTTEKPIETTTLDIEDNTSQNNPSISIENEVVRLVNLERKKAGLSPLSIDNNTAKVARLKSEDMRDKNYFNHTSPTYGTPFDMLKQFNITYKTAGENIAKGQKTASAVVEAWMNSEGHKRNILSKSFTHIGVGLAQRGSTNYWTQMFISK